MSFVATGIAAGTGIAGYLGAKEQADAQKDANSKNYKIAKMELEENKRQFDLNYGQENKKIEEMMRQFNLNYDQAKYQFDVQKQQAEQQLALKEDQFKQTQYEFEKSFGLSEDQLQETMRQYNLSREDALSQYADQYELEKEKFSFEKEQYGDLSEKEIERRKREAEINKQVYGQFQELQAGQKEDVKSYTDSAEQAISKRNALMGLSGKEAQEAAYSEIMESPGQKFLRQQQEKSLLRNAAAIGGLGGGNVRTGLQEQAYKRSTQAIDDEISKLNALASEGLAAKSIQAPTQPGYVATGTDTGAL